jgi:hypothetical protein
VVFTWYLHSSYSIPFCLLSRNINRLCFFDSQIQYLGIFWVPIDNARKMLVSCYLTREIVTIRNNWWHFIRNYNFNILLYKVIMYLFFMKEGIFHKLIQPRFFYLGALTFARRVRGHVYVYLCVSIFALFLRFSYRIFKHPNPNHNPLTLKQLHCWYIYHKWNG